MTIHAAVIQKLLSTNAHTGRRIVSHHLKPYLHGSRNSLAVVDSEKTLISLRSALAFITELIRTRAHSTRPARFLFVNTNPLYDDIFDHMTRISGFPSFLSRRAQYWRLSGFLTNPHSPKLFRGRNKRLCFAPVDPPDCVVLVDPDTKCSVIKEAARVGVPVVALVDSKTPIHVYEKIAYPIVVGAESVQFVYMMCNLITKTFQLEKRLGGFDASATVFEEPDPDDVPENTATAADASSKEDSDEEEKEKEKEKVEGDGEEDEDEDEDSDEDLRR